MSPTHQFTLGPVRSAVLATLVAAVIATLAGCGGSAVDAATAARARTATDGGNSGQAAGPGTGVVGPAGTGVPTPGPGGSSTGGGTGTVGGGGGGSPTGAGGGGGGGGGGTPPASVPGASCAGFKNGPGITNDVVRIGNASDISGPVPGLFTAAQQATRAYVEYFNNSGARICGRKLALDLYDSRTDAGGDQGAYAKGCETDFAMVGSMSAFDLGGAQTAENCGIPDIRAIATTVARGNCRTCFGAQPAGPDAFENAVPDFIIRHTGGKKAAMLYISVGAAAANGESQVRHEEKRGVTYVVKKAVDVAEFNYAPYVQAMKSAGVDSVQFIAASPQFARMDQAMQAADFHPKVVLLDPSAYNDDFTTAAGAAGIGTVVFVNFVPFEQASSSREESLYLQYLQQVNPGAKPTFFGLFAWSAARLFAEQATKLGGGLTRASLVASMKKVDNWTANGLHAPQHVGSKKIADCWRFLQWTGSVWKPIEGGYQCRGITSD